MGTYGKLILAALAATMLLSIAVTGAAARNLRVNERNFEWIWDEGLGAPKTKKEITVAGNNIRCRVTYLGSFTEFRIVKETGARQGQITHVEVRECVGGTARPERLPWSLNYRDFTGFLPRINSIGWSILATWKIRAGGLECEFGTETLHPAVAIVGNSSEANETGLETTGEPNNVTLERNARIPLGGGFVCEFAGEVNFGGIALVRNLPRTATLRYTLI